VGGEVSITAGVQAKQPAPPFKRAAARRAKMMDGRCSRRIREQWPSPHGPIGPCLPKMGIAIWTGNASTKGI
jgi:hypothetical protein